MVSSVPVPALEEIDTTIPDSAQAELDEEITTPDQSEDVQIDAEMPLVPENVDVEVDNTLVSEDEGNSVAAISLQTELMDQCLPYAILFESPALCNSDGQGDESLIASAPLQVGPMDKCLPYSIISVDPAICEMSDEANMITGASMK